MERLAGRLQPGISISLKNPQEYETGSIKEWSLRSSKQLYGLIFYYM